MSELLDYIIDHIEIALLVPVFATGIIALFAYCANRSWDVREIILLGVPVPLAMTYILALGRGRVVPDESVVDALVWRVGGVVLFAPQILVLLLVGIIVWACVIKHGCPWPRSWPGTATPTLLTTLAVAALGHFWTKAALSGL